MAGYFQQIVRRGLVILSFRVQRIKRDRREKKKNTRKTKTKTQRSPTNKQQTKNKFSPDSAIKSKEDGAGNKGGGENLHFGCYGQEGGERNILNEGED